MPKPLTDKDLSWIPRVVVFLALLYFFLGGIELLGASFKSVGKDVSQHLINTFQNPFIGLAVGILSTVIVQSSSVTTSMIVGLVGQGDLDLTVAVPMVMGANVGTTITNTLVSLGHLTHNQEFRRAFAGATVHDFFNLLTVAVVLPLELATGFLRHGAQLLVGLLPGDANLKFQSPIKEAVKTFAKLVQGGLESLGLAGGWLAFALFVLAVVIIIVTLIYITRTMKSLMAVRIEQMLNRLLAKSGIYGLLIGVVITVSVQSSSITTSLLIPMFGAGLLSLEAGFPIMIGANIGTTVTALLAATVTGKAGLTIALVHLLFNCCGTLIFFPWPRVRRIPVRCAEWLAEVTLRNRLLAVGYVAVVFVVLPALGIFLYWVFRALSGE